MAHFQAVGPVGPVGLDPLPSGCRLAQSQSSKKEAPRRVRAGANHE